MRCPFCGAEDTRVINSRPTAELIRRRRECQNCERRFTTVEYVEKLDIMVVKRDGTREPFELAKLRSGISRACEKRSVSAETIDEITQSIEREVFQYSDKEVPTEFIGKQVLHHLKEIDHVAYLRFASVYKQFHDLQDFNAEIRTLLKE